MDTAIMISNTMNERTECYDKTPQYYHYQSR